LLIAALAILSTVVPDLEVDPEPDREDDDLDELFFAAFAMTISSVGEKTLFCRNGSLTAFARKSNSLGPEHVKGTAARSQRCPSTWSAAEGDGRSSALRLYEHPSPTSLLNHETSDHLLSLR
jgi:hypothetical protein